MTIDEAIEIKGHNRYMGILCPTPKEFEADDLSIEALRRHKQLRQKTWPDNLYYLPGETKN